MCVQTSRYLVQAYLSLGFVQAKYRLAQCYLSSGKTQLAKEKVGIVLETDSKNAEALNLVSFPSVQSHCHVLVLSTHSFPTLPVSSNHPNQTCTCVWYLISFLPLPSSHLFLAAFIVFFPLLHSLPHLHSLSSPASPLPHPLSNPLLTPPMPASHLLSYKWRTMPHCTMIKWRSTSEKRTTELLTSSPVSSWNSVQGLRLCYFAQQKY